VEQGGEGRGTVFTALTALQSSGRDRESESENSREWGVTESGVAGVCAAGGGGRCCGFVKCWFSTQQVSQ